MRTVFLGSGIWGYRVLETLVDLGVELAAVFTFEPDPHERWEHDVAQLARDAGLPLHIARRLEAGRHLDLFRSLAPQIGCVVGWRTIIPREFCDLPPKGLVGVHASLLPRYRGFAPINWAIIEGERRTGVTLFHLSDIVDGGDIIGQRVIDVLPEDTAGTVAERAAEEAVQLVRQYFPLLQDGCAPRVPQDHSRGFWRPRRRPEDGRIDWSWPAGRIYDWVRALTRPYPGAFTYLDREKLTIWRIDLAEREAAAGEPPGTIIGVGERGALVVASGKGLLRVEEIEPAPEAGQELVGRRFGSGEPMP